MKGQISNTDITFSHIWKEWLRKPYKKVDGKQWFFKIFAWILRLFLNWTKMTVLKYLCFSFADLWLDLGLIIKDSLAIRSVIDSSLSLLNENYMTQNLLNEQIVEEEKLENCEPIQDIQENVSNHNQKEKSEHNDNDQDDNDETGLLESDPFEHLPYYHGEINRQVAEKRLVGKLKGTFLTRFVDMWLNYIYRVLSRIKSHVTDDGHKYVLSWVGRNKLMHSIVKKEEGMYR